LARLFLRLFCALIIGPPAGVKIAGIGLFGLLPVAIIAAFIWQVDSWSIWVFTSPLLLLGLHGKFVFARSGWVLTKIKESEDARTARG
jgi:hypothetical protein